MCEAEDSVLLKLPCYKSVTNLVPLRKSALSKFLISYVECGDLTRPLPLKAVTNDLI